MPAAQRDVESRSLMIDERSIILDQLQDPGEGEPVGAPQTSTNGGSAKPSVAVVPTGQKSLPAQLARGLGTGGGLRPKGGRLDFSVRLSRALTRLHVPLYPRGQIDRASSPSLLRPEPAHPPRPRARNPRKRITDPPALPATATVEMCEQSLLEAYMDGSTLDVRPAIVSVLVSAKK